MTAVFEDAIKYVLENEGGYSSHPADPGGATNGGISLRFLKNLSPEKLKKYGVFDLEINEDTIFNLTPSQINAIYKGEFWDQAPFDQLPNQKIANYIFDMAVNHGIAVSIKMAQRSVWACMASTILVEDGILGSDTLSDIKHCFVCIVPTMKATRAEYYRSLISASPSLKPFQDGWLKRAYRG